jgi:hypothetical protein
MSGLVHASPPAVGVIGRSRHLMTGTGFLAWRQY